DPDVPRLAEVHGLVDGAALDADGRALGLALVPEPRAALRTEDAAQAPAAVGVAGPGFDCTLLQPEIAGAHDHGNAEGRGRLLAAFPAVTNINPKRLARDLIAHRAALAAAG